MDGNSISDSHLDECFEIGELIILQTKSGAENAKGVFLCKKFKSRLCAKGSHTSGDDHGSIWRERGEIGNDGVILLDWITADCIVFRTVILCFQVLDVGSDTSRLIHEEYKSLCFRQ